MKFSDLENQGRHELEEQLKQERVKLGKLRFELANKALKDVSQLGKARRSIAQLLTALSVVRRSQPVNPKQ